MSRNQSRLGSNASQRSSIVGDQDDKYTLPVQSTLNL